MQRRRRRFESTHSARSGDSGLQRVTESSSMTSSDQVEPKRRRGLMGLVVFLLVLFGLYSAGWFYAAGRVRDEAAKAIAALGAKGIQADCSNLAVGGYPLRFAVTCDSMAYEDDARNVAASAGGLNAAANILWPLAPSADITGPLRTMAPGMAPLWLDWDRLRLGTRLWWPMPSRVSVRAEGLSGQTDPADDSDPVQLFSAGSAEGELSPDGADLDYSGSFRDLRIDPGAVDGRTLPPFDGSGTARIANGMALLKAPPDSLRGQSARIGSLQLSSGEARVTLSGPIAVDGDGLIDADLTIRLEQPKAVAEILATAVPERASEIRQGFAALAMLGNQTSMPLKVVKGKASLGFIPLGRIKPVD